MSLEETRCPECGAEVEVNTETASTIDTPPEERLPIKTAIAEYDETLIRTAILRELDRGGQVYFVHNRVMGIEQMAQRVARIVPEATIAVAHGQMPERQLERVYHGLGCG